eukprot:TRINITY_DN3610_c0_g1_i5.p1 TRINITY_DN3610_c0_g1~~TRINITY_DN3610_c0_g1_i5.p1  ORF type:complete len:256 (+),score=15.11 TRINITY_DN3610_c0_g1_i5:260-1027(+)
MIIERGVHVKEDFDEGRQRKEVWAYVAVVYAVVAAQLIGCIVLTYFMMFLPGLMMAVWNSLHTQLLLLVALYTGVVLVYFSCEFGQICQIVCVAIYSVTLSVGMASILSNINSFYVLQSLVFVIACCVGMSIRAGWMAYKTHNNYQHQYPVQILLKWCFPFIFLAWILQTLIYQILHFWEAAACVILAVIVAWFFVITRQQMVITCFLSEEPFQWVTVIFYFAWIQQLSQKIQEVFFLQHQNVKLKRIPGDLLPQ